MPRRFVRQLFLLLAWPTLALGGEASAQECEEGRISSIVVDNRSIFDTAELDEDASFRWFYELANTLHMDTRASFLRNELLVDVGDCFDTLLLEDSERILRSYPFLSQVEVSGARQPDGTYEVAVETRDEWTTKVDLGVAFDEGFTVETLEVTEENVTGRGILVSAFFRERRERRDLGLVLQAPRLFSTRMNPVFSVGRTRVGTFFSQGLLYPFVGEIGRVAGRQVYARRESIFPYAIPGDGPFSHVILPFEQESVEMTAATRLGRPGNLTVLGLGFLWESLIFDKYPGEVEVAIDSDFSDPDPAGPDEIAAVFPHVNPSTIFRLNFLLGQRNVRFIQRAGLDGLTAIQDVPIGTDVAVTVGKALGDVGSGGRDSPDDLYLRFSGLQSWDPGNWILAANANWEGRAVFSDATGESGLRDVLGEVDLYMYRQHPERRRHTFFARISGSGGWSALRPFQLTLGGRAAVRGYGETAFPGGRRIVATVEDRIFFNWPAPRALDFGATLFADAGRVWAGDVPFGETSDWQASVGAGLRIGFPSGTRTVTRIDLAVPVTGPSSFSSAVFRVNLQEVVGLFLGFSDEEMVRSRRPAVGADRLSGLRR